MTKKENDNLIMKTLLDIKEDMGTVKQRTQDIHDQLNLNDIGLISRVNKLETDRTKMKTKLLIFTGIITTAGTVLINIVKQQFGL